MKTFKGLKEKDYHLRILHPATVYFKNEGEIKAFPDKLKLRNHAQHTCTLRNTKRLLQAEMKDTKQ